MSNYNDHPLFRAVDKYTMPGTENSREDIVRRFIRMDPTTRENTLCALDEKVVEPGVDLKKRAQLESLRRQCAEVHRELKWINR
jgi:hypothetical protein